MKKTIYKYHANLNTGIQPILVPNEYKVLSAGVDPSGDLCVWVEVNPAMKPCKAIEIVVIGTGHVFEELELNYIGTVLMSPFVWHVYWRPVCEIFQPYYPGMGRDQPRQGTGNARLEKDNSIIRQ